MSGFNYAKTSRQGPNLSPELLDKADELVENEHAPRLRNPRDTAQRLVQRLPDIRAKLSGFDEKVDGITPLARITVNPRHGVTSYHLTSPARELLRSQQPAALGSVKS